MPSPTALQQGLELFRIAWPHRFADQATAEGLIAIYALGCEELTNDEWLAACRAALKASDHLPLPAELNRWVRPDRDPNRDPTLDYRPVNTYQAPPTADPWLELPPASPETIAADRARHQAEWEDNKAALLAKWNAMKEEEKTNPKPGPGMSVLARRVGRRRPKPSDYAERGIADMHLEGIAADLAEHRDLALEEGNAAWVRQLQRQAVRRSPRRAPQ